MSMEDLWLRQSVQGWVLFLGIKSVYSDKIEITEASASVGVLLATAVTSGQFLDGCRWCLRPRLYYPGRIWKLNKTHSGFVVVENLGKEIKLFFVMLSFSKSSVFKMTSKFVHTRLAFSNFSGFFLRKNTLSRPISVDVEIKLPFQVSPA